MCVRFTLAAKLLARTSTMHMPSAGGEEAEVKATLKVESKSTM